MGEEIWEGVRQALGLDARVPDDWQMGLRAMVVYIAALAIVRLGEQRFLVRSTVFDVILVVGAASLFRSPFDQKALPPTDR